MNVFDFMIRNRAEVFQLTLQHLALVAIRPPKEFLHAPEPEVQAFVRALGDGDEERNA